MEKIILHPGNGIDMPVKGDYVKINLKLKDDMGRTLFDSEKTNKKFVDIR